MKTSAGWCTRPMTYRVMIRNRIRSLISTCLSSRRNLPIRIGKRDRSQHCTRLIAAIITGLLLVFSYYFVFVYRRRVSAHELGLGDSADPYWISDWCRSSIECRAHARIHYLHGLMMEKSHYQIPHILHQSAYSAESVPVRKSYRGHEWPLAEWMHSWPEHHPTWRYLFWSWEDTQLAVQSALPQYEQLLKLVGDHRMRLDIGRYVALYLVGGVSVESDVECLATLSDDITIGHETFFISKPEIVKKILYDGKWRPDISILGSRPGHHFWLLVLDEIARNVEQGSCRNRDDCSGANLIAALYDHTEGPTKAIVLESQALFPTLSEADRIEMRRVCKNGGNGDDSLQWECDELEHLLTRRRTMATQGFGIIHGIPDQSHTLAVANIVDVIPPSRLERPFEDPSQWPWWPRKKQ